MIGIQEIQLKKYCQNFLLYCIKRIQIVLMIIMIIQEEMNLLIIEHYLTKKLNISQKNIQRLLLKLKNFQMYICFRQFLDLLESEYTFLDFLLFLVHQLLNDLEQNHALISFLFYLFLILIKINHHYYLWKDCTHIHKQHMVSQLHLLLSNLANIWNNSVFYQPLIHIVLIFILPSSQHFTNILWRSLYYLILHRHQKRRNGIRWYTFYCSFFVYKSLIYHLYSYPDR